MVLESVRRWEEATDLNLFEPDPSPLSAADSRNKSTVAVKFWSDEGCFSPQTHEMYMTFQGSPGELLLCGLGAVRQECPSPIDHAIGHALGLNDNLTGEGVGVMSLPDKQPTGDIEIMQYWCTGAKISPAEAWTVRLLHPDAQELSLSGKTPTSGTATPTSTPTATSIWLDLPRQAPTPVIEDVPLEHYTSDATPVPYETSLGCGDYTVSYHRTGYTAEISLLNRDGEEVWHSPPPWLTPERLMVNVAWCQDVTGDGVPEVALYTFPGANWCAWSFYVFSLETPPRMLLQHFGCERLTPVELDGHPPLELLATDDRFVSFGGLSTAASPYMPLVFALRDGVYVDATRDFPDVIRAYMADYESTLPPVPKALARPSPYDETLKTAALAMYARHVLLGEEAEGWAKLQEELPQFALDWLDSHRAEILAVLAQPPKTQPPTPNP